MNLRSWQFSIIQVVPSERHLGGPSLMTLTMAQLSGRNGLRDIVENLSAQMHLLHHIGSVKISRSSLSRINFEKCDLLTSSRGGPLCLTQPDNPQMVLL